MQGCNTFESESQELEAAISAILQSTSKKKLIVAGPGTGKTTLFKRILGQQTENHNERLVLTFINNLKRDLERDLQDLANVHTLHSFCIGLLHQYPSLRNGLSTEFSVCPRLASLIGDDWEYMKGSPSPKFVGEMRNLEPKNHIAFYIERGNYYDAVDFDDSVYRTYIGFTAGVAQPRNYELVLIDEYQDFNLLEAGVVEILGENSPIIIAGDDDQALYSQLRNASSEFIRSLKNSGEYEIFELPFCMRCPKVIIDAVNEVIAKASQINKLKGRIEKVFRYYPPIKGNDSFKYPKITLVETSTQSNKNNYMGKYIEQEIRSIPQIEIEAAIKGGYPAALVIAADPYRKQIIEYLQDAGLCVETNKKNKNSFDREDALSRLKKDECSNLGWRIILEVDKPQFLSEVIQASSTCNQKLVELVPDEYKKSILSEVQSFNPAEEEAISGKDENTPIPQGLPEIRVTSFEGSKGMSGQHIYIAGLHNKELPRNPDEIEDLEICKFIVGLTRTRKKCTLLYTRQLADQVKEPSIFISWISRANLDFTRVNKQFWEDGSEKGN